MKKYIVAAAIALFPTLALAGPLDDYNAKLNSATGKAALLKTVCGASDATSFNLCNKFQADGVPDTDVRIGIMATAALVGAAAGGAVFTTPAVIGQHGALHVLTWVPTLQGAIAAGAGAGAVVGATSYLVK